ncbi:hypothetical protein [Desulfosporosinus nitroreducens]|uniref:CARDB domain-containing protein n=1 Tax=Desulfosporosinus nitroreducens TaxID=2018668 RepID=A0ABT8QU33_9FIRM|nr:hypothetical protein [Desulfosporosinus nitroreducens]MDO0824872.1 hypothetical protein [Desulfosporosinus nitroreducens]
MNRLRKIISALMFSLMLITCSFASPVFAADRGIENINSSAMLLPTPKIYTNSPESEQKSLPNGVPITVTPYYDKVEVWVGNIGADSLDSVTVMGTATDYGTLKAKTSSVPPVVGKTFTWYVPQTKCLMEYKITIVITDAGQTVTKNGYATLEYTEAQLASVGWNRGSFPTRVESLEYHFNEHKSEIGAKNICAYINSAITTKNHALKYPSQYNITVSNKPTPGHKYKHKTSGIFIILADSNNEMLSHGR